MIAELACAGFAPIVHAQRPSSIEFDDAQLQEIVDALGRPGATILIYGDQRFEKPAIQEILGTLKAALRGHNRLLFMSDEFDEITNEADRARFGKFIAEIGDRRIPIRFVLYGVSAAVKAMLGAHESSYGIESFELQDQSEINRLAGGAAESNAPHYIHLVSEKLFWEMFNDPTFAASLH